MPECFSGLRSSEADFAKESSSSDSGATGDVLGINVSVLCGKERLARFQQPPNHFLPEVWCSSTFYTRDLHSETRCAASKWCGVQLLPKINVKRGQALDWHFVQWSVEHIGYQTLHSKVGCCIQVYSKRKLLHHQRLFAPFRRFSVSCGNGKLAAA